MLPTSVPPGAVLSGPVQTDVAPGDPLQARRPGNAQRLQEGAELLWVAPLVLRHFPPDLFGRVLVIVLLISGHRLERQEARGVETRGRSMRTGGRQVSLTLKLSPCSRIMC